MTFLTLSCPPMPHYVISGQCVFRPGDKYSRRVIKNVFDLIYVRKGCLYITQSGQNHELHEGQYLIVCPLKLHNGYKVCDGQTIFEWVHFATTSDYKISGEQELAAIDRKENPNVYYNKEKFPLQIPLFGEVEAINRQTVMSYFEELQMVAQDNYQHTKEYVTPQTDEYEQQIIFLKLLKVLESPYTKGNITPEVRLRRYIDQNYKTDITIEDLAADLAYSTSHIIRLFNKKYGISPKQYAISLRIADAMDLLAHSTMSVNDISDIEGFGASSQFISQFRKSTGQTPLQYRKSQNGSQNNGDDNSFP